MIDDLRDLHRDALALASSWLTEVRANDLDRDSPCEAWTLADLLAHMIGQHRGFALAVRDGTAPVQAYAPTPYSAEAWRDSVAALQAAFAGADLDQPMVAIELSRDPLPVRRVLGAQLLDTVVHTWDIARSLGTDFVPPEPLLAVTAALARGVPDQARGPGAAFAASVPGTGDAWGDTLASLGRRHSAPASNDKE